MNAPPVLEKVARAKVPPLTMTVPGRASSTPKASVPAVSVVAPVKPVLARVTVSVPPAPFIVSAPAPPSRTSSETAVVAVTLSVVAARTPVVPVSEPAENVTVPVAWLKLERSSVPPLTAKALVAASWLALPNARPPAETVVAPVKPNELVASSASVPAPILVSPPAPMKLPASVPPAVPVDRLEPAPLRLTVPPFARTSMVSAPPSESVAPGAIVTPEVEERRLLPVVASVPAAMVVAPE